ncbi:MAG: AAA family ATPase [Planctomycetaceae bacterium]|nr:AAA family ATPase [Planctomycetaceae bacterium]
MSDYAIQSLSIHHYKSIRRLQKLPLDSMNILIGANGAGKSNFVSFFTFLSELVNQRLQAYIAELGGAKRIVSADSSPSECFATIVTFAGGSLIFIAGTTEDDRLQLLHEKFIPPKVDPHQELSKIVEEYRNRKSRRESRLLNLTAQEGLLTLEEELALTAVSLWRVYHFHDTSAAAPLKHYAALSDNKILSPNASNLAAVLYRLRGEEPEHYEFIRTTIEFAVPYFEDFVLKPRELPGADEPQILLRWRQKGAASAYNPHQFSDGTIRFICLAAALLQPNPPATMIFDEPELGLHPSAIELLASMLHAVSLDAQILVSTQSPPLLSRFEPENVLIVEQQQGNSTFRRVRREELGSWLDEYSLGQLWEKNILGGRPK